jgi:hypothetical protein
MRKSTRQKKIGCKILSPQYTTYPLLIPRKVPEFKSYQQRNFATNCYSHAIHIKMWINGFVNGFFENLVFAIIMGYLCPNF